LRYAQPAQGETNADESHETDLLVAVGAKSWAARFAESRSGYGMLAMGGIEVGAAVVIIAFGTLLLAGYIVTERMVGI
jgi:hypothetical protein